LSLLSLLSLLSPLLLLPFLPLLLFIFISCLLLLSHSPLSFIYSVMWRGQYAP
jgi:hypothetical protein